MRRTEHLGIALLLATACGDVNEEMLDAAAPDAAPRILSFSPAHGSNAVFEDRIEIEFSEPMDRASVEAAFDGDTFAWNGDGTQVAIAHAFPFTANRVPHVIVVPATITDLAGTAMAADFTASVTLAALVEVSLDADPSLIGNDTETCGPGTFFQAGDMSSGSSTCPNELIHAAVTFPLAALPAREDILAFRRAAFKTHVVRVGGNPNSPVLDGLVMDHITITSISQIATAELHASNVGRVFAAGEIAVGAPVDVDVLALIEQSLVDGAPSLQLRIRPAGTSNNDASVDVTRFRRIADENDDAIDPSLVEPDPANRARIEIAYFQ